jgi:adenine-specific DNA-methyltransferase
MASLLKEFRGKIDLIYIDPPFDVGRILRWIFRSGDGKETLEKTSQRLRCGLS